MPFVRSGGYLPDKAAVEDMRKKIAMDGTEYYRPLTPLFRNESTPMFPPGQQPRKSSVQLPQNIFILPSSIPRPTASTPFSHPAVVTRTHSTEQVRMDRPSSSTSDTVNNRDAHSHWPTLSASGTPKIEVRDIPQPPFRKTSWAPVSTLPDRSSDSAENVDEGLVSSQSTQAGGAEGGGSASMTTKPSLREILEQEQRHGPMLSHNSLGISTGTKAPKLSQKERRRLLQQQLQPEASSSSPESVVSPSPTAWARVTPGGATDSNRTEHGQSAGMLRKSSNGGFSEVEIISGSPIGTPSLLDIQQGELALLRAQPKEVPRVAMATSKPVKETL